MPGTRGVLIRIAFLTGLLLPVASHGSASPSQTPPEVGRSSATARTSEPESVRSALTALVSACANWPQELPASPEADFSVLRRGTPFDAALCDSIADLGDGRRFPILMASLLITAVVLGTFAGAFVASASLFRLVFGSIRKATFAARGGLSSLGDR